MSPYIGEADALVEAVLSAVGMDGMDVRCPIAVIRKLGWYIKALASTTDLHGAFNLQTRTVGLDPMGSLHQVRERAAHEGGHIVLVTQRIELPHDEAFVGRVGRAICMGRAGMVKRLRELTIQDVLDFYTEYFSSQEVCQRIWEVRQTLMRRTG